MTVVDIVKRNSIPCLLLTGAVFLVYFRILDHSFILNWDDNEYLVKNPAIRGFSLENLSRAFSHSYAGNYAPLQILSYMLDYTFWGMNPTGYFLSNILLHLLNGILLYALMMRLYGNRLWAFCAAGLFLLHPVQVESVAWASQRKNLLAMFFFLLSFFAYLQYREGAERNKASYGASLLLFLFALLAKPVAAVLPVVLFSFELTRRESHLEFWQKRLIALLPYAIIALAGALLTLVTQSSAGYVNPYFGGSIVTTGVTMLRVVVTYLNMLFYPLHLSAIYAPEISARLDGMAIAGIIILFFIALLGWVLVRRRRQMLLWFILAVVAFLPVSQIVPLTTLMNDRYLYFPLLGLAPLITWPVSIEGRKALHLLTVSFLLCLIIAAASLSHKRAGVWKNGVTLWSDTVTKAPAVVSSWVFLLEAYYWEESMAQISPELLRLPQTRSYLQEMLSRYLSAGNRQMPQQYLVRLASLFPGYWPAHYYLGRLAYFEGKHGEAGAHLQKAAALSGSPLIAFALGDLELLAGKTDAAQSQYKQAEQLGADKSSLLYREALLALVAGNIPAGGQKLRAARQAGFSDRMTLQGDPLLSSFRTEPFFDQLLQ